MTKEREFEYLIKMDQIMFNNVEVQMSLLRTPYAHEKSKDGRKQYKLRILIPKEAPATARLFKELSEMYCIAEAQLLKDTKNQRSSIRNFDLIETDDPYFQKMASDYYAVISATNEDSPPELIKTHGVTPIINKHDVVRMICSMYVTKNAGVKSIFFRLLQVGLIEHSTIATSINSDLQAVFFEGLDAPTPIDTNNEFAELEV